MTPMPVTYTPLVAAILVKVTKHVGAAASKTPRLEKWLTESATDDRCETVHTTCELGEGHTVLPEESLDLPSAPICAPVWPFYAYNGVMLVCYLGYLFKRCSYFTVFS